MQWNAIKRDRVKERVIIPNLSCRGLLNDLKSYVVWFFEVTLRDAQVQSRLEKKGHRREERGGVCGEGRIRQPEELVGRIDGRRPGSALHRAPLKIR